MKWLVFLLPFTLFLTAAAQTGKASSAAQKPQSISGALASVEGTVVNSLTGKPLDDVHVTLASYDAQHSSPNAVYGAMTSSGGHFSILRIPPTRYLILLEHTGFLFVPGAGNRIVAHGWLQVKAGDQVRDLTLEMVPRAIISGRVLDEYGDPVMNVEVTAIPVSHVDDPGFTPLFTTNDRGEFRIVVPSGKYYVKANWRLQSAPRHGPPEVRTDGTVEARYLETYYPGAGALGEATPLETRAGRELSGVDVTLARSPVLAIRGTVSDVPSGCILQVRAAGRGPFDGAYSSSRFDGAETETNPRHFELAHLRSGEYRVFAYATCTTPESHWLSSIVDVALTDSNAEEVNLVLAAGTEVAGNVAVSGKTAKPSPGESWRVVFQPIAEAISSLRSEADTAADGSFTVKNIFFQRYRISVSPLQENGFVKSIFVNGAASPDRVLDFSGGAEGVKLKIILGMNGAQLSGRVKYKDDTLAPFAQVLLLPDRDKFDLEIAPRVFSTADGEYSLKGLAPGRYKVLAITSLPGTILDHAPLIKDLAKKADIVELKEGEELHKELRLVDSEDTDAP